jgi:hypothetical protein
MQSNESAVPAESHLAASVGVRSTALTSAAPALKMPRMGPSYRGAENQDLSCLQAIENIDAGLDHFQEFQTSLPHANSSKELHFEEWPPRTSKKATCITYNLTDGQQINTGYGRASRSLYRRRSSSRSILVRMLDIASSTDVALISNDGFRISGRSGCLGRTATRQARPSRSALMRYPRYSV